MSWGVLCLVYTLFGTLGPKQDMSWTCVRSNRGVIEDLKKNKRKNKKKKRKIFFKLKKKSKIYLGISLELLQAVWVRFSFR